MSRFYSAVVAGRNRRQDMLLAKVTLADQQLAATNIQRIVRGNVGRVISGGMQEQLRIWRLHRYEAARTIQCMARCYLSRRVFVLVREEYWKQRALERAAANCMIRAWKAHRAQRLAQRLIHSMHQAAILIQKHWRRVATGTWIRIRALQRQDWIGAQSKKEFDRCYKLAYETLEEYRLVPLSSLVCLKFYVWYLRAQSDEDEHDWEQHTDPQTHQPFWFSVTKNKR